MSSFRTFIWDPFLLVGQMACLQSVFYTAQSILMVLYGFTGYEPYLSHIFSFQVSFMIYEYIIDSSILFKMHEYHS